MGLLDRQQTMNRHRRPQSAAVPSLFDQPTSTRQAAIHKLNKKELDDDALSDRHKQIIGALRELGPSTMKKVAEHINLPINCVTGRFLELREHEPKRIEKFKKKQNEGSGYAAWSYRLIGQQDEQRSASSDSTAVH